MICTGSELVSREQPPRPGQVISGNRLLLDGLIRSAGGVTESRATVPDRTETIAAKLAELIGARIPLIITTGGVGPGKFDLMREVFSTLKIRTVYDSLQIRPGRATMLGVLADSMIFALPGPPPAVNLLFHELVKPALLKSGGGRGPFHKALQAELAETITREPGNLLLLKEGEYSVSKAKLQVRPASGKAEANCILPLSPGSKLFEKGELLTIHPTAQLF
ncbi:MAG: molybdopterin-binding protein [Desulfurivibrionaceae bacterium]